MILHLLIRRDIPLEPTGIVNLFVEKKIIDELKRGKEVESNERLGILSC